MKNLIDYSIKRKGIDGKTLAARTKQRNWMIVRLRGAIAFSTELGLIHHIKTYNRIIKHLRKEQIADKKQEMYLRKIDKKSKL